MLPTPTRMWSNSRHVEAYIIYFYLGLTLGREASVCTDDLSQASPGE